MFEVKLHCMDHDEYDFGDNVGFFPPVITAGDKFYNFDYDNCMQGKALKETCDHVVVEVYKASETWDGERTLVLTLDSKDYA